ncbi:MAG TPA: hypothetical protein VL651_07635 [Bacteroidia bacterium]|jgi:hypothetical protein|nr:hypothetical protein [Bacteroidia bacterium]
MSFYDRDPGEISPREIGYMQAFKAITVGLIIAFLIMTLFAGIAWIINPEFSAKILLAVVVMYVSGYFFGGMAGWLIIKKRFPSVLIGIAAGLLITWSATFAGSLIGYFAEGVYGSYRDEQAAFDYIVKPLYWVTLFGLIPILGVGIWYGISIDMRWRKIIKAKKDHEANSTRIASR